MLGLLKRRGIIESRDELTLVDDDFAEREPALAQLAVGATTGLVPAGPDVRKRPPIAQGRLRILPSDLVHIELRRRFSDGDAEECVESNQQSPQANRNQPLTTWVAPVQIGSRATEQ